MGHELRRERGRCKKTVKWRTSEMTSISTENVALSVVSVIVGIKLKDQVGRIYDS